MIVYRKKIIEVYRNIPILEINDIPFGAIINRTPGDLSWWPPKDGAERLAITADVGPIRGIIPHQKHYFPESPFVYSSHSLIHTFLGRYFETTNPEGRHGILTPDNLDPCKVYLICMYTDAKVNTSAGRDCFYEIFNLLDGEGYDYLQIFNHLIHELFDADEDDYNFLVDLGKNKTVCSVTAALCWLNFYQKILKETNARRPLGRYHPERVPPCLFESPSYNNETFKIIGRLRSGLLD
jgi:hypothetical protein